MWHVLLQYTTIRSAKLKLLHSIAVIASCFLPSLGLAAEDDRLPGPIQARVLRVVDGDTVLVRARIWLDQDVETNVRLFGVDTPEKRSRCETERELAQKAADFTSAQLGEDWITLRDVIHDKYGRRVVARIFTARNEDLAALLIANRLATAYDGGGKKAWCDTGRPLK